MLLSFKHKDALDTFFDRFAHLKFHKTDGFSLIGAIKGATSIHVMLSAEQDVLAKLAEAYNYVPDYQI